MRNVVARDDRVQALRWAAPTHVAWPGRRAAGPWWTAAAWRPSATSDALLIAATLVGAHALVSAQTGVGFLRTLAYHILLTAVVAVAEVAFLSSISAYERRQLTPAAAMLAVLVAAAGAGGLFFAETVWWHTPALLPALVVATVTAALLSASRAAGRASEAAARRHGVEVDRVIVLGPQHRARRVEAALSAPESGCSVVASFTDCATSRALTETLGMLGRTVSSARPDVVVLAFAPADRRLYEAVAACVTLDVHCVVDTQGDELPWPRIRRERLGSLPVHSVAEASVGSYHVIKRLIDVVSASLGLLLLAPLGIIIALLVKLDAPGPVFYRQQRIGRRGRRFTMLKFRSMRVGADRERAQLERLNEADGPLFKMRRDPRVTRVGSILRRTSLDELPQLFNVLNGAMSLVGPRPPIGPEVERYAFWQRRRLAVTPGLTGLWQVSGRSDLSFQDGVALDLYYIDHCSPALDLRILAQTVPAVVRSRGAY